VTGERIVKEKEPKEMSLINRLTKAKVLTPGLRQYLEAIKRGQWLNIAGSTMNTYERQIACSWFYQYRAYVAIERKDIDLAEKMAEHILLDNIRYETWIAIRKQQKAQRKATTLLEQNERTISEQYLEVFGEWIEASGRQKDELKIAKDQMAKRLAEARASKLRHLRL
jgi:hypothetical protein